MATYSAPTFNKIVAPGALTHHCRTKMVQKANDRKCSHFNTTKVVLGTVELMPNPFIHI